MQDYQQKVYRFKEGFANNGIDPTEVGERISQIEIKNRDAENIPDLVIEDAKHETSPMHGYFVWDNDEAAVKFRRHQAQMLLCSIEVTIINPRTEEEEWTRAFHPVTVSFHNEKDEKPTEVRTWTDKIRILNEADLRTQIIEKARMELDTWRKRYEQYTELGGIVDAIRNFNLA